MSPNRLVTGLGSVLLVLLFAIPAAAQIEDQLSAYTGDNATGYLQPLADAFGADLNGGLFYSGKVPQSGPHFKLEVRYMSVQFGDDDRTFNSTTEGSFSPSQSAQAPTIVGGEAVEVEGDSGTVYLFPGGFQLDAFALAVPQLRIGAWRGTEALVRYFAMDTGDVELGKINLFGIGVRHDLSQYMPSVPVDIAGGFFWQTFSIGENDAGDDLISTNALSIGVQASRGIPLVGGAIGFEPYAGLSFDKFSMDVAYEEINTGTNIDLNFDSDNTMRLTLGLAAKLYFLNVHGEYNVAGQNSVSLGAAVGM